MSVSNLVVVDQGLHALLHTVDAGGVKVFLPPSFVKSASAEDPEPSLFGDPSRRRFPCDTASQTWLSALDFYARKEAGSRPHDDAVGRRIDAAAGHHGILPDVEAVKAGAARLGEVAAVQDGDYAMVYLAGGETHRRLPLRNALEVKAACDYLHRHRDDLSFDDRRTIALKVLAKSASAGLSSGDLDDLDRQAGRGTCGADRAAGFVHSRAEALRLLGGGDALRAAADLTKIAIALLENPRTTSSPARLVKVASLVDRVDREFGLRRLSTLPRPEDTLFAVTAKSASDLAADHFQLATGEIYAKSAVAGVPLADVRAVLGDDIADAVSVGGLFLDPEKMAEVAATLPRGDARILESLFSRRSVEPAYREPRAAGPLADPAALAGFAASHRGV